MAFLAEAVRRKTQEIWPPDFPLPGTLQVWMESFPEPLKHGGHMQHLSGAALPPRETPRNAIIDLAPQIQSLEEPRA